MKEIPLATFEEFEKQAKLLLEEREKKRKKRGGYFSPVLFRGQAKTPCCQDEKPWRLETSLERHSIREDSQREYSQGKYYHAMRCVKPTVASCTENRWDPPSEHTGGDNIPCPPPDYPFMVYLRHHDFPSPLLDWTRSFYIAAFFAFWRAGTEDSVAIYSYIEYYGDGKPRPPKEEAFIVGCGPTITTHKRHVLQQSEYTFCRKLLDGKYVYCSHEEAFARDDPTHDILTRFIIPYDERDTVLAKLDMMNITPYSLFEDEKSLSETLAYRMTKEGIL